MGLRTISIRRSDTMLGPMKTSFFWHDVWEGDTLLPVQFPNVYRCARNPQAKVKDYVDRDADRNLWGPIFKRDSNG